MSALAQGEIEREARRVLRRLMLPEAKLVPSHGGAYALMIPGAGGLKQRMRVAAALVDAFRRCDWLNERDGTMVLSDAGLGWIRRALAGADAFQAQHRALATRVVAAPDGRDAAVTVNEGESPLGWLYRRRGPDGKPLIAAAQFEAGERLRSDFTLAQLTPRMAVDLSAPVVAGRRGAKDSNLTETVIAARQRFARALDAVGPGLSDLLIDVCCHLIGLEAAERANGWPVRSAKVVLSLALDRLAQHYGIAGMRGTGSRLRAWHAPETESQKIAVREP